MLESYLLKPHFKARIQNRDEWNGFLPRSLRNSQEERGILSSEELLASKRVLLEEGRDEGKRVIQRGEVLEKRRLGATAVDSSKSLFDAAQPIANKVLQRFIHPALLVRHEHQANHPQHGFFVCHIAQIESDTPILLPSKPRLREIFVQFVDDLLLAFRKPQSALFLRHLEDGVIEFLPKFDSPGSDLVDRLA